MAHIKVGSDVPEKATAVGSTPTSVFTFNFTYISAADIKVYRDGVLLPSSEYTLVGNAADRGFEGGEVTLNTAISNKTLLIKRATDRARATDFPTSGTFDIDGNNTEFDAFRLIAQEIDTRITRSLRFKEFDANLPSGELPTLDDIKGKYLRFNITTGEPEPVTADPLGETTADLVGYTPSDGGAATTVQTQLRYFPTVRDFGAIGIGDETAKFQAAIDSGRSPIFVPKDDYTVTTGSLTGQDRATGAAFIGLGPTINGVDRLHGLRGLFFGSDGVYVENYDIWLSDGFTTAVDDTETKALILATSETEDVSPFDPTLSKTPISTTVRARGAQVGVGFRANLVNYSTASDGCTAIYGRATSDPGANWSAASHGETRHAGGTSIAMNAEAASYSNTGSFYGMVVSNTSGGAPATVPHAITGGLTVKHDTATGILMNGTAGTDKGEWRYGIRFRDGSLRAADGEGIRFEDAALYQIRSTTGAVSATADIFLEADSGAGIILGGTYTSGNAIRMDAGQAVAWEASGVIKTFYDAGGAKLHFASSGNNRVSLELDPTPAILLNGTQVLAERATGWGAPTGTATRTAFATGSVTLSQLAERVKAIIDDLTTHGIIGA